MKVTILSLDGIELITESKVVLVTLLDLEDLSLQLGDQKVFLVGSQMHTVVILWHTNITVKIESDVELLPCISIRSQDEGINYALIDRVFKIELLIILR